MIPHQDILLITKSTNREHRPNMSNLISSNQKENTVEISEQDIKIRNNTIAAEIVDESEKAVSQKRKIITLAREYAYNLEQLVDLGLVDWPKDTIFNTILENLSRKGINAVGRDYVYQAFNSEDYDKFKYIKKHRWLQQNRSSSSLANNNNNTISQQQTQEEIIENNSLPSLPSSLYYQEKAIETTQMNNALLVIEQNQNNPVVKERLAKLFSQYEKEQKKAKQQEKDLSRICMEKPEPKESSLEDLIKHLGKICPVAATNVHNYPPLSTEDDVYFKNAVSLIIEWVQSIADRKWSRSIFSWIDIHMEQKDQSTHCAMSKSKIECRSNLVAEINSMMRKVTREQIDAKHPIIIKIAKKVTELAELVIGEPGKIIKDIFAELIEEEHPLLLNIASRIIQMSPLIAIDIYKDTCQAPWNGGFHIRRHEKLSESAFGNASLH